MKINKKQQSFLSTLAGFILGCIIYETGYYFIKGQTSFKSTPFVITGALVVTIIGIIAFRNK